MRRGPISKALVALTIFALVMIGLGQVELATLYFIGLPAVFFGVIVGVVVTAIGSALTPRLAPVSLRICC